MELIAFFAHFHYLSYTHVQRLIRGRLARAARSTSYVLCRGGENRERLLLARLSSSDGAGGQKRIILDILELSMESDGRGRVETLRPLRP